MSILVCRNFPLKYEDMKTALMLVEKEDLLCTFDLTSGYHYVDIHPDSQSFLGFKWKERYYVFTVLPFGLATACYVFTKLLRGLVKLWRGEGIDDGIIMLEGRGRAERESRYIRGPLEAVEQVVKVIGSLGSVGSG